MADPVRPIEEKAHGAPSGGAGGIDSFAGGIESDALSPLLACFNPTVRAFFAGEFCGLSGAHRGGELGYLHFLRSGRLTLLPDGARELSIIEPSVIFMPRPTGHRLRTGLQQPATLVCATVDLSSGMGNPLAAALPAFTVLPLRETPTLSPALELLFAEAGGQANARQAALDRLLEYILILLLRHILHIGALNGGMMAGLADPRLARSIAAMHRQPGDGWTLQTLADVAGMSRARFAHRFHKVVGTTPLHYLTTWRLSMARALLERGMLVKTVAASTGYQNNAAFTRAFYRETGVSPTQWLTQRARQA